MPKGTTKIEINGQALKKAIYKRGYTPTQLSKELGYSHAYLDWQMRGNYTVKGTITVLEKIYGIPYSEYELKKPDEKEVATHQAETQKAEELKKTIYNAAYTGVYQAITDAIKAGGVTTTLEELKITIEELSIAVEELREKVEK